MNSFKQVLLQMQVAVRGGLFSINDGIFDEKRNFSALGAPRLFLFFCLFVYFIIPKSLSSEF